MNVKGVYSNIRKVGLKRTWEIFSYTFTRWKKLEGLIEPYLPTLKKLAKNPDDYTYKELFEQTRAAATILAEYRLAINKNTKNAQKARNDLKKIEEKKKGYKKFLKQTYIKEVIPATYEAGRNNPIEEKVIFMENGKSPSASSKHIGLVLEKQKKYDVKYIGLFTRIGSLLESYESAVDFIREMTTAKAVFISTANNLLSQFDVRPETKVIQLWHGAGMFKKCGYSTVDNANFGLSEKDREEYDQYRNYSYVTIAGEGQAWTFEDAFRMDKESGIIVPVGISRTDLFFDDDFKKKALNRLQRRFPQIKGKKIILYAPTFRGKVGKAIAPDQMDIAAMGEALSDEYVLLIKHHGLCSEFPPIPEKWEKSFAIDMGVEDFLGIDQLLAIADICITDYSSIAFEYAIMEKPMIFYAYDLDEYVDSRGMYFDYNDITPGPVCKTTEEMIDYIRNIDELFNPDEVAEFRKKYVDACDGHATERTIALIEK